MRMGNRGIPGPLDLISTGAVGPEFPSTFSTTPGRSPHLALRASWHPQPPDQEAGSLWPSQRQGRARGPQWEDTPPSPPFLLPSLVPEERGGQLRAPGCFQRRTAHGEHRSNTGEGAQVSSRPSQPSAGWGCPEKCRGCIWREPALSRVLLTGAATNTEHQCQRRPGPRGQGRQGRRAWAGR